MSLYSCWQGSTLLGLVARGALGDPRQLGLELIFPLSFSVLLWPQLRDRPRLAAALSAGAVSLALRVWLPGGPNLFAGVLAGCLAGLWVERRHR